MNRLAASDDTLSVTKLDVARIRAAFPAFQDADPSQDIHYLDNAATTQKPQVVLDAIHDCYAHQHAPVHRGLYEWAEYATERYENARADIAQFIGAESPEQLIFTRSATESINMVAQGWAAPRLKPGDEVWVSRMEHHANFLPWQRVCQQTGARLRLIELHADGTLDIASAAQLLGPNTRLIALCHVSNVLGIINPVRELIRRAAQEGIPVLLDGAQSVGHMPLSVRELGCDFLVFSAHKMFGPTGIGALYARDERLAEMEPLLLGGGMVDRVGDDKSTWVSGPSRFEAGSPNLAGAVGLAGAVRYIQEIGLEVIFEHSKQLVAYAMEHLCRLRDIQLFGPGWGSQRTGILSFVVRDVHPHDIAQVAAEHGVAIRAGHHCCQPLMRHLGVVATARVSFGPYNQPEDIDALIGAIDEAHRIFH